MKQNYLKLLQNLIFGLILISVGISTLLFLPTTSEFFEFNKFTAIFIITSLGTLLWTAKMVIEARFKYTKSPIDLPMILLVSVLCIASLTSIDQFSSIIGTAGKLWPTLFAQVVLVIFYFLTATNINTQKQVGWILWALITATFLASLVSTVSFFGFFLPFDFAQNHSFNTFGIATRLALVEAMVIPLSASFMLFSKSKLIVATATAITITMIFSLILINFMPSYLALAAAIIFIFVSQIKTKLDGSIQLKIGLLLIVVTALAIIRFVPPISQTTISKPPTFKNEISWEIATRALGKRPLFGTGPNTYQFAYTQLKPRSINLTDNWPIRFEKAQSEFTEIITTTGIFGTLAYLIFIFATLKYLWLLIFKGSPTSISLAAAIVAYVASNFVTTASFATAFPFFLCLGLLSALVKNTQDFVLDVNLELSTVKNRISWLPLAQSTALIKTATSTKSAKSLALPIIFLIVTISLVAVASIYQFKAYQAEYFYRQSALAARSNDGNRTLVFLKKAISQNGQVDTYHRAFSQTSLNAALNLSRQSNLDANQQKLLKDLVDAAIEQAKIASGYQILPLRLPGMSPANVANWESLSSIYQVIMGSDINAQVHATSTLAQAASLDPENPILHDQLGLLYQRTNQSDLVQRKFEDAIIVKGDFGPAHYHLAKILIEKQQDPLKIVNELNLAQRFLPQNDPAQKDIEENLEIYNKQLEASASATPTSSPAIEPSPTSIPSF